MKGFKLGRGLWKFLYSGWKSGVIAAKNAGRGIKTIFALSKSKKFGSFAMRLLDMGMWGWMIYDIFAESDTESKKQIVEIPASVKKAIFADQYDRQVAGCFLQAFLECNSPGMSEAAAYWYLTASHYLDHMNGYAHRFYSNEELHAKFTSKEYKDVFTDMQVLESESPETMSLEEFVAIPEPMVKILELLVYSVDVVAKEGEGTV